MRPDRADRRGIEPPRTLILIAKEPVPGRVKTRLHEAFSPAQAARLAEAGLRDTVAALLAAPAERRVVALDGAAGAWLPPSFSVVAQPEGGLDVRLAAAFVAALGEPDAGPAALVGMDTPHLGPYLSTLDFRGVDALLGLTEDGGFWVIGLRAARDDVFLGVPMSTDHTGEAQLWRLRDLGLRVRLVPTLRDVDRPDDARAVARAAPGTRFAAVWREVVAQRSGAGAP